MLSQFFTIVTKVHDSQLLIIVSIAHNCHIWSRFLKLSHLSCHNFISQNWLQLPKLIKIHTIDHNCRNNLQLVTMVLSQLLFVTIVNNFHNCLKLSHLIRGDPFITFAPRGEGVRKVANYANDKTDRLRENANRGGEGGPKSRKFCQRNKWMPPNQSHNQSKLSLWNTIFTIGHNYHKCHN